MHDCQKRSKLLPYDDGWVPHWSISIVKFSNCHNFKSIHRWVKLDIWPQEDACEIPVPKWIDQGVALV